MGDIFLLRHGKSDWQADVDDFHRPLKERGKRAAQRIGHWMQQQGYIPDVILSSPATRALETTEKTVKVMGLGVSNIQLVPGLYEANLETMLGIINQARQEKGSVLIVGHNPSMEMALNSLVYTQLPETDDGKIMPTAALAHLSFASARVALKNLVWPKTLPKQFQMDTPSGEVLVDRPAYYYRQSGVIPYRWYHGELQILLVTKSDRARWGVPKGIIEPGYSAENSAAKEALEEAGVIGEVTSAALGHYLHEKWGGVCHIVLFPMAVTEVIDDASKWESHKRSRHWFSIREAQNKLDNDDIKSMLTQLASQLPGST